MFLVTCGCELQAGRGWLGQWGGDICRELEGLSRSDLALRGNVGLFERSEFTHVATRF